MRRREFKRGRRVTGAPRHRVTASQHGGSPASALPRQSLITLLTDFGNSDYFAAAMKGVVLSINPAARVVDITHEIPPQDVEAAAFTLFAAYESFPTGTIHVAVVDPGVGSFRRPIVVQTKDHLFVGPDNGILSYVIDRESGASVFHVTNNQYFRRHVSATFHGRDVFAPVAAALSLGVKPSTLGVEVDDAVRLASLQALKLKDGLKGRIIHVDHFGNCITNITRTELTDELLAGGALIEIAGKRIRSFRRFFAEHKKGREKLFAIWGSAGFLEIAAENRSAAKLLRVKRGQAVVARYGDR